MDEYQLLTATRFDNFLRSLSWNNDVEGSSPFLLLPYHFQRLVSAAEQHGWSIAASTFSYETLKAACIHAVDEYNSNDQQQPSSALKIRLQLSQSGGLVASVTAIPPITSDPTSASFFRPASDSRFLHGPVSDVYIDSEPIPVSIFTTTKTTNREVYDRARSRAGCETWVSRPNALPPEVLLYNDDYIFTEASSSNVAFHRSNRWYTPSLKTGCLPGTLRRWLLENGRISEADDNSFHRDSVRVGDFVLLFNSVRGCYLGLIAGVAPNSTKTEY